MAELYLRKLYDTFAPADDATVELMESLKGNSVYKCVISLPRNYKFHKKLFSLFNLAFDHFQPEDLFYEGVLVKKNFNEFRSGIVILAGFYTRTYDIDGKIVLKAESLKFASMSQERFDRLYSACIDVVLDKVLTNYTRDDVDRVINEILGYV